MELKPTNSRAGSCDNGGLSARLSIQETRASVSLVSEHVPGQLALSVRASPGVSVFLQRPDVRQPKG